MALLVYALDTSVERHYQSPFFYYQKLRDNLSYTFALFGTRSSIEEVSNFGLKAVPQFRLHGEVIG